MALAVCAISASAPLTVLAGGVTATFAVTGNVGVPLSFIVLGVILGVFVVGFGAMARHVSTAGAFHSYIALGLGRVWGVAASCVALVGYNAIQISLYGLWGSRVGDFMSQTLGITLPWYVWAYCAMAAVAVLGVLRVDLSATVLAVLLVLEVSAVLVYDVGAFAHPAGGVLSLSGLSPTALFGPGVGVVFAFGVAAFTGFESTATYSEEVRKPRNTVTRATFVAIACTSVLYAVSALATTVTVGTGPQLQEQSASTFGRGPVFGPLVEQWGPTVAAVVTVQFFVSVFAALLAFHNVVARYLFALGRERVLPRPLSRAGRRSGGPVGGSILQSVIATVVVLVFAVSGGDPFLQLFGWLSAVSAVAVVLLMLATSLSVIGFFWSRTQFTTLWRRLVAPAASALLLLVLAVLLIGDFDVLLGSAPGSPLVWILPGLVLVAGVVGGAWGAFLRSRRPWKYAQVGHVLVYDDEGPVPLPTAPVLR